MHVEVIACYISITFLVRVIARAFCHNFTLPPSLEKARPPISDELTFECLVYVVLV